MIKIVMLMAITTLQLSSAQPRIMGGSYLSTHKRYVAYFSKMSRSIRKYDAWICGGAIVTVEHIITAAACLEDVKRMYAIAGYDTYVPSADIDKDPCTSVTKKQVIQTCYPKKYSFEFSKASKWSNADIGVARIKGEFDFNNVIDQCSYAPGAIAINYHTHWQADGMHALVMGWGHNDTWRNKNDTHDYNSKKLKFAKVKIVKKQRCINAYSNVEGLADVITTYMICTHGTGRMNETGDFEGPESFERDATHDDGCALRAANGRCLILRDGEPEPQPEPEPEPEPEPQPEPQPEPEPEPEPAPEPQPEPQPDTQTEPQPEPQTEPQTEPQPEPSTKPQTVPQPEPVPESQPEVVGRSGICQNDHGSPLVTYAGRAERLIGIASVFLIDPEDRKCKGPFLYTSTFCNQQFLRCFFANNSNSAHLRRNGDPKSSFDDRYLDMSKEESRRFYLDICLQPPSVRGFEMVEKIITWPTDGYDGDNENGKLEKQTDAKPYTKTTVHTSAWPHARVLNRPIVRSRIRSPIRSRIRSPISVPIHSRIRSPNRSYIRSHNRSAIRTPSRSITLSPNRSIIRSPNRSIIRSRNRSTIRSLNRSIIRSPNRSIIRSSNRSIIRSPNRSIIRSPNRSIIPSPNRSIIRSHNRSIIRSPNRSIIRSLNRSIIHSSNRSIIRSHNQSIIRSHNRSIIHSSNRSIIRSPNRLLIRPSIQARIRTKRPTTTFSYLGFLKKHEIQRVNFG